MLSKKRFEIPPPQRLNLIPIMDAIFLFIFFLLTSSQVIKFFEINSDAPVVQESESDSVQDRLDLIVKIDLDMLTVLAQGKEVSVLDISNENKLIGKKQFLDELLRLKKENALEKEVTLKPSKEVPFQNVVEIMDVVRSKHLLHSDGDKVPLFPNIVLEPIK